MGFLGRSKATTKPTAATPAAQGNVTKSGAVPHRPTTEILQAIVNEWNEEGAREKKFELTYERSDFLNLLNGGRCVVLGRKGSGKTVALSYVEKAIAACNPGHSLHSSLSSKEAAKPVYVTIDLSTVSLNALSQARNEPLHFWMNMIHGAGLKALSSIGSPGATTTYYLGELIQMIGGVRGKAFGVDFELTDGGGWEVKAGRTKAALSLVAAAIQAPIKIFIGIDKLDTTLKPGMTADENKTYNEILTGLFQAVSVISDQGESAFGRKLTLLPIVSMRSDLTTRVLRADSHKWVGDMAVKLSWGEVAIQEMLAHRLGIATGLVEEHYKKSGSIDTSRWFIDNWESIFDSKGIHDDFEPGGGIQRRKFEFVATRTMGSPRDYTVQIANYAARSLKHGGHRISKEIMALALPEYAKSTLNRVRSESVGLDRDIPTAIADLKVLVNSVRADKRRFTHGEITKALGVASGDRILHYLYRLDVIGNINASAGKSGYRFCYMEPEADEPQLLLAGSTETNISLHPTVWRGLRNA